MTTTDQPRYRPFSNGSEFDRWQSHNCQQCANCAIDDVPTCPGDEALTMAYFDDGTISTAIADFIGTTDRRTDPRGYNFCDLVHLCNHYES